jgi:methylglutaconyl-CoA hydratase
VNEPWVISETAGSTATITLNRSEKRNALTRAMLAALTDALRVAESNRAVRVVTLGASGAVFSAGMDLAEMQAAAAAPDAEQIYRRDAEAYLELLCTITRLSKPVLAIVEGPALAGGAGLVAACDVVLAGPRASFGLPEIQRGIIAAIVAPFLLLRVAPGVAAYLLETGQTIDCATAQRFGLFHEVVPAESIAERLQALVHELCSAAPNALAATKRFWLELAGGDFERHVHTAATISAGARASGEAREGLAAFLERRPARWTP